jgi:hypothetical protein
MGMGMGWVPENPTKSKTHKKSGIFIRPDPTHTQIVYILGFHTQPIIKNPFSISKSLLYRVTACFWVRVGSWLLKMFIYSFNIFK